MKGFVVKDDVRYEYVQRFLAAKGHGICLRHPPEELDFIIFPFMDKVDSTTYNESFFSNLRQTTHVFSGTHCTYLDKMCAKHGLQYHVMLEDVGVATKNAVATSEGVIAHIITDSDCILQGAEVLVVGYGKCGRDLARRLNALNANVCALVRNSEKEAMAWADGVKPIYLSQFNDKHFDVVVNTIPNVVLAAETLEHRQNTLFLDIASKPYGFNMTQVRTVSAKSAILPGLPGKYAAKTSGQILGEYVDSILKGGVTL